MVVSACLWGLREPPAEAARKLAGIGVDGVDVDPGFTTELSRLSGTVQVKVKCLAADHLMPPDGRLGNPASRAGRVAIDHVKSSIGEASRLGAEAVYVGPPPGKRRESAGVREIGRHSGRRSGSSWIAVLHRTRAAFHSELSRRHY